MTAIRQPVIADPGQECHGVCGNDDAAAMKLGFLMVSVAMPSDCLQLHPCAIGDHCECKIRTMEITTNQGG